MVNSFAISKITRGVALRIGGTGIVDLATGVSEQWVSDNFVAKGQSGDFMDLTSSQLISGEKTFTQGLTFRNLTGSGNVAWQSENNFGANILEYNPYAGQQTFIIYDFAVWHARSMDFWHREAYDANDALAISWKSGILSGNWSAQSMTISGTQPVLSTTSNLNLGARTLASSGPILSIDWQNRTLSSNAGATMVHYQSGLLNNTGNTTAIDWNTRQMSGRWRVGDFEMTGRVLTTGNYGITESGIGLFAGVRSAVYVLNGPSGYLADITTGRAASCGVIFISGNGITGRLPDLTAASFLNNSPTFTFKMVTAGTGTISGNNINQTIDGQPRIGLSGLYKFVTLQPYGSGWYIIGQN